MQFSWDTTGNPGLSSTDGSHTHSTTGVALCLVRHAGVSNCGGTQAAADRRRDRADRSAVGPGPLAQDDPQGPTRHLTFTHNVMSPKWVLRRRANHWLSALPESRSNSIHRAGGKKMRRIGFSRVATIAMITLSSLWAGDQEVNSQVWKHLAPEVVRAVACVDVKNNEPFKSSKEFYVGQCQPSEQQIYRI